MQLSDVRLALREHWLSAAIAFLLCLGVGVAAISLPAPAYDATADLTVTPRDTGGNSVSAASFVIPNLVEVLSSDSFSERASLRIADDEVRDVGAEIAVSNDLGSGIIRVKATSPMPEAAAAWANALAAELVADIDNQQSLAEAAAAKAETADAAGLPTTDIEQVDAPLVRVDLVDSAAVPTSPSGNPLTLLVGTTTIGIIAAVLTSIVVARVRRSRDVEAEVWSHLDSPVLSELPAAGSSPKQWVAADGSATNPALVESIQRLRANVELALDRQLDATIGVVAARSSDDTSAVVMALGRSFADLGRSVGLIDADLRRPSLDRVLGRRATTGLGNLDGADPSRVVRRIGPSLVLLPAGTTQRHPAEVVPHVLPRALEMMSPARLIIVRCPPLDTAAESVEVATSVGSLIVVIDGRSVSWGELQRTCERLRRSGVMILGIVLNGRRRRPMPLTPSWFALRRTSTREHVSAVEEPDWTPPVAANTVPQSTRSAVR